MNPTNPRRIRGLALLGALLASLLFPSLTAAGGYLVVDGTGTPYTWAVPVSYNLDLGDLGLLTNAQADALTTTAISQWDSSNISTTTMSFLQGIDLPGDVTSAADPLHNDGAPDGFTPVIYDTDGAVTAALFGGAEFVVIGYAGPRWVVGTVITEGRAVLNGRFVDGLPGPADISLLEMQGVATHEIGHMLNLDHAQFNASFAIEGISTYAPDYSGFPTMYPFTHGDNHSLELDDRVWLSSLYPDASFAASYGVLAGRVTNSSLSPVNGVNIVARATNPSSTTMAISCVTGYTDGLPLVAPSGEFRIPGLDPSTRWTLDVEPIPAYFSGGSSVGPIDPPLDLLASYQPEYINDVDIENFVDAPDVSDSFDVTAGVVTFYNLPLNDAAVPGAPIIEIDTGNTPATAMVIPMQPGTPITILGTHNPLEGGPFAPAGDPIEDWYELTHDQGFEVFRVTLTSALIDCDLFVCSWDEPANSVSLVGVGFGPGNEVVEGFFASDVFGNGLGAGKIYLGVSGANGEPAGAYTLNIEAFASDAGSVVIHDVTGTAPGTLTIRGRGFKELLGLPPIVAFDEANLVPLSVNVVSGNEIEVVTNVLGPITNPVRIIVRNDTMPVAYAGRVLENITLGATDADLQLTISDSPDPVIAGTIVTYTASLYNRGPGTALDVSVPFTLSPGAGYAGDVASAGVFNPGTLTWDTFSLAVNTTETLTLDALVDAAFTSATVSLSGMASSALNDPMPADNTTAEITLVSTSADLEIVSFVDDNDPVVDGDDVTYTYIVRNNGPSNAEDVLIRYRIPAGMVLVSHPVFTTHSPPFVDYAIANLAPGLSLPPVSITINVPVGTPSQVLSNLLTVISRNTSDPDSTNNSQIEMTTVNGVMTVPDWRDMNP